MIAFLGFCLFLFDPGADLPGVADTITLKDGLVLRGQILPGAPRGKVLLLARREWLQSHAGARFEAWLAAERPWIDQARAERRARLEAWKAERNPAHHAGAAPPTAAGDPIGKWLDSEIRALAGPVPDPISQLMILPLDRAEVAQTEPSGPLEEKLLRLGWRAGFADVETMSQDELTDSLTARGLDPARYREVAIDHLLPLARETEDQWRVRRAATEASREPGLNVIQSGGLVLPEGADLKAIGSLGLLSGLLRQLADDPLGERDPLEATREAASRRGRSGLLVTSLEMSPDLGSATVTRTLWVRGEDGRWSRAIVRSANARASDARGAEVLATDPQVKGILDVADALGLAGIDPSLKGRSLAMGAATQQALDQAREAFESALVGVRLEVDSGASSDRAESP